MREIKIAILWVVLATATSIYISCTGNKADKPSETAVQTMPETRDVCYNIQPMLDSLHHHEQLNNWLNFYKKYDMTFSFSQFKQAQKVAMDFFSSESYEMREIDTRNFAISPDKKFGITYDGYFIDLSKTPEDEIGFDDSHDINIYDFNSRRISRLHFKGLSESTDDLFWLDNNHFMILGAKNTGKGYEWIPYIQIANIKDSTSCIYQSNTSIKNVSPFNYLIQRLKQKNERKTNTNQQKIEL